MDFTLDQFRTEAQMHPVVVKVNGFMVPVDVPALVAAASISGLCIHAVSMFSHYDMGTGTRLLILTGISWEPFVVTKYNAI